jgi:acetyl-CoA carboxylase biotin carboxyl carrier protein
MKISDGDSSIKISTATAAPAQGFAYPGVAQPVAHAPAFQPSVEVTPAAAEQTQAASAPVTKRTGFEVKSPFVGTFYAAPAPGEDNFVSVGTRVKKGDTLCIVEAMKLMNEIEAEKDGVISEILIDNEAPVEFDQILFVID